MFQQTKFAFFELLAGAIVQLYQSRQRLSGHESGFGQGHLHFNRVCLAQQAFSKRLFFLQSNGILLNWLQ